MGMFTYGIACSLDQVSDAAPIILRGDMDYLADTASKLGYEAIELQMRDPQRFDWAKLRKTAEQAGLKFSAIATGREYAENGLWLLSDDKAMRRAAIDKLKIHIDMGAAIGAMVIVGSMRKDITDFSREAEFMGRLNDAFWELSDYAAAKNVTLVSENILSFTSNFLNTMRQVTDHVRLLNRKNILVHLDTYSMLMEDNDIAGSIAYCADVLEYVHFADSARLFCGGGNVDFKTFMKQLHKAGYNKYVVVECVPVPDAYTCAKNCIEYMKAMEEIVRIELSLVR